METNKTNKNKIPLEIILVVPLGVERIIFPWGIHSVREYLEIHCEEVRFTEWDLRNDPFFESLKAKYGSILNQLFLSLRTYQQDALFGVTSNPDIFLGLAAATGEDFLKFASLSALVRPSWKIALKKLNEEMKNYLSGKIREYCSDWNNRNRVWSFSVYDYTLFNSLFTAELIRQHDPDAAIVFGGDYFTFDSAIKAVNGTHLVDGIVVGYGEEVMRHIVEGMRKGESIDELLLQGLVNKAYLDNRGNTPFPERPKVPPVYKDMLSSGKEPVSYVRMDKTGEIRVLSQRGCSWGECLFCAQIDKQMYFPVQVDFLIKKFKRLLKDSGKTEGTVKIIFDSDENSIEMLIPFIQELERMDEFNGTFDINLWLQVKSLWKELKDYRIEFWRLIAGIDHSKIHIHFMLNFESLNFETLRNMRKGHLPLQAIEAAKVIQDSGHTFSTNYFTHFPMETAASVSDEVEILRRMAHLLMPPHGGGNFFPYFSNNRDTIFQEQKRFKVKIKRMKRDHWLKKRFDVDLPFSIWAHTYDEKLSPSQDRLLIWSYHHDVFRGDAVHRARRTAEGNWGNHRIPNREKVSYLSRRISHKMFRGINSAFTAFGKGKAFRERTELFNYFSKVMESEGNDSNLEEADKLGLKLNRRMVSETSKVKRSYFYKDKNRLYKNYHVPGNSETGNWDLNPMEHDILKYLYWTRKRSDVIQEFKDKFNENEINRVLNDHIQYGAVVPFKNLLLCVVNDKEYWK